jgi:DNA invertase Pin-like site-specific DNA recombinase
MTDARQRKLDVVVVWKLDRFGRSLKHLVNALAEFEALGIIFASLKDNLDLSTPSGRLMFQIIGAMAEFERSLIRERVMAGLRNAKAKGQKLGRPRVPVDASRIAALRAQGHSWSTIHRETGIAKGTAQRAFYNLIQITSTLARELTDQIRRLVEIVKRSRGRMIRKCCSTQVVITSRRVRVSSAAKQRVETQGRDCTVATQPVLRGGARPCGSEVG